MELVAVPPKDRYCNYVSVRAFWRSWEVIRMLWVLSPPKFAYYASAYGENAQRFGYLLHETETTKFTVMFFVCSIQAAK